MTSLDKIVHERVRLLILTYLAGHTGQEVSFNELKDQLDLSAGNLSIQLKKLKAAGYVDIDKTFKNNKPYTTIVITVAGADALTRYLDEMEHMIKTLKKQTGK